MSNDVQWGLFLMPNVKGILNLACQVTWNCKRKINQKSVKNGLRGKPNNKARHISMMMMKQLYSGMSQHNIYVIITITIMYKQIKPTDVQSAISKLYT